MERSKKLNRKEREQLEKAIKAEWEGISVEHFRMETTHSWEPVSIVIYTRILSVRYQAAYMELKSHVVTCKLGFVYHETSHKLPSTIDP